MDERSPPRNPRTTSASSPCILRLPLATTLDISRKPWASDIAAPGLESIRRRPFYRRCFPEIRLTIHAEPIRSARWRRDRLAGVLATFLLGAFAAAWPGPAQEAARDDRADGERAFGAALADSDAQDFAKAQKEFETARALFKRAGDLPREIESLYRIGRLLWSQGKADLAIETLQEA